MLSLLIVFFLIAITVSFLCSLWEVVLLSVTPSYAQMRLQEGAEIGAVLQSFKEDIDRPLAAILTLNTIAHTVGAIGVGNQAAALWSDTNPMMTGVVVPVLMTLAILILSELIPKTLGANNWEDLAPFTVRSLQWIIRLLGPLVWLSRLITGLLKKDKSRSVFSRRDFLAMAELGAKEGVIKPRESRLINNLLHFDSVCASDVMTPRTVALTASADLSIGELFSLHPDLRFSRIPIHEEASKDHITGYFLKADLLNAVIREQVDQPIHSIRRDIMVVAENYPLPRLFDRFLEKREHIAVVVGEFGGMSGLVTTEDVIETLLGLEIVDELDNTSDMRALARRHWEARAKRTGLIEEQAVTDGTGADADAENTKKNRE